MAPNVEVRVGAELFRGPLPHPEHFAAYERSTPGSGNRIITMAERQIAIAERVTAMAERQEEHRQSLEVRVIDADITSSRMGLNRGFIIAVLGLIGGTSVTLVSLILHSTAGVITGGGIDSVGLATLAGVFVYGSQARRAERQDRLRQLVSKEPSSPKR